MKRILLALFLCAFTTSYADIIDVDFSGQVGIRRDHLQWSIAGPNHQPNILSELTWNDLDIAELGFDLRAVTPDSFVGKASMDYGIIFSGKNQDSDYWGDNRTIEFSRSDNNGGDGYVLDGSGGVGYALYYRDYLILDLLIGLSYHTQQLRMTDGLQVIPDFGPFPGLNSQYNAEWWGPWLGIDFECNISTNVQLTAGVEYHLVEYQGEGHWNLRNFTHPFVHQASGNGVIANLGLQGPICNCWEWGIQATHRRFSTNAGTEEQFELIDNQLFLFEQPFNGALWSSTSLSVSLGTWF
jgi:hypothetical protein